MRISKYLVFSLCCFLLLGICNLAFADNEARLTGRAFIPLLTANGKITERFFSFAPIEVVDIETGEVVARGETEANGSYVIFLKVSGSFIVEIGKGNRVVSIVVPRVRRGRSYSLGFTDTRSTALSLVLLRLMQGKKDPGSVITYKAGRVLRSAYFGDLEDLVRKTIALGKSVKENREIQELIEKIATPFR